MNYAALGFCVGILATSGILVAFLEQWLHVVMRIAREEKREATTLAEGLGLKMAPAVAEPDSSEPRTRR